MRRVRKVLDITKEEISFRDGAPLTVELCNIRHSSVHYHSDVIEMVLCLKGTVSIYCNHEHVTLSEGEIFTIVHRDLHCIWSEDDNITALLHLDTSNPQITLDLLRSTYIACEDISCLPFQREPLRQVKAMIMAFAYKDYFGTLTEETSVEVANKIGKLLLEYFNWFSFRDFVPTTNPEIMERMLRVIDYCEAHYMEKLTISSLADSVHISEKYFSQFFKHCPYGSFSLMVGYVRCFYAQWPLLSSELSVIDIAQQCGFSDVKYFYKNFRYWWKQTPKEFRQWFSEYTQTPDKITRLTNREARAFIESYAARIFSDLLI